MQDLTLILGPDRAVAEVWETLGDADIALEASCTFPAVEGRNVRIVVADEDASPARTALLDAGIGTTDQHEVVIAELEAKTGALGRLARRIADAGAQLHTLYMARGDRIVIGADDLDKVRASL